MTPSGCSEGRLPALTAVEVLKAGGNALDAAIAAVAVQFVVEAGSTGIGGDCFAFLSVEGSTDVRAYNGSGRTPAALTRDLLVGDGVTAIGRSSPHAVTVPSAVDAWCRLARDFAGCRSRSSCSPRLRWRGMVTS